MASDDMRLYKTFYGIHLNDWNITFGSFSNHHKLLVEEFESDAVDSTPTSAASNTYKFIFPEHIKKTYFIEGTIKGHVTFAASGSTAYLCKYRLTVCKVHQNTKETELFSTGWVTVNDTLTWDSAYNIGQEIVYPFRIDAWEYEELDEYERIYVKIESTCSDNDSHSSCSDSDCSNLSLWHSNDANWEDLKIEIPFKM